jgi:hypothetical protein
MFLEIQNDGQKIISTNYWDSEQERAGYYYVSINAGAFRLLIPAGFHDQLPDMRSAKEVIISRGPWPDQDKPDACEILFDDHSDNPYALFLSVESFDRLPLDSDAGREFILSAWTGPALKMQFYLPCFYRRVEKIPCLKPWR